MGNEYNVFTNKKLYDKKEKLLQKFLQNPEKLKFSDIYKILADAGFYHEDASGSHIKIFDNNENHYTVSLHNNDCKGYQKKALLKFYLLNKQNYENAHQGK